MRVVFDFDEKKPRLEEKVTVTASEFKEYRDYIKFFRWLRVLVLKSRPTRKQHLLFPQKAVEKKSIVDNLLGGKQGELNAGTEQTESSEPGPESKPKPRKPRAKRAA